MTRPSIAPEDVDAQLMSMTKLMVDVMALLDAGTHRYGRVIAQKLEVPYPQAYHILNVLSARRFLWVEWDVDVETRKVYGLTPVGRILLQKAREKNITRAARAGTGVRVDPEKYVRRMRIAPLVCWLVGHGLIESREDLDHIMHCPDCDRLLRESAGWNSELRCDTHPRHGSDTTGE